MTLAKEKHFHEALVGFHGSILWSMQLLSLTIKEITQLQGGEQKSCSKRKCRICPLQPSFEIFLGLKLCTYQRLLVTQTEIDQRFLK